jgi:hypothetical protein
MHSVLRETSMRLEVFLEQADHALRKPVAHKLGEVIT